ncbi:hypothetical protein ANN_16219 [Periplaneta americana]|uniref:Mutator-like transposase domain-containing protein n=1 Tax=Periplaneta americana TaxID=6978 RepID=A0ABQ8SJC7_PERAM|nr:hypothetical protein ANN_16219 [Periplaneta americana]
MDVESDEYKMWLVEHKANGQCDENFTGTSGAMEAAIAKILWQRSLQYGFRYTTLLSDGDAKTHKYLKELAVYGSDVEIKKDECLNHIAKRLGSGLRNTVKEWKIKKVTLGGKKPGHLKEETIVKLCNYYRSAVKKNIPNVDDMKSAIYATSYHCMSTNENPQHFKCPGGENSWCFYNRAWLGVNMYHHMMAQPRRLCCCQR